MRALSVWIGIWLSSLLAQPAVWAAETAREMKLLTVGLLGGDGGKLLPLCDKKLLVPHTLTQRIQEEHIFIIHLLVELIESDLYR